MEGNVSTGKGKGKVGLTILLNAVAVYVVTIGALASWDYYKNKNNPKVGA